MRKPFFALLLPFLLAAPLTAACGVRFEVPRGWVVHEETPRDGICSVSVSPRNWDQLLKKSRFGDEGYGVMIKVFTPGKLEGKALRNLEREERGSGFDRRDDGVWALESRGRETLLEKTTIAGMPAYEFDDWVRGYAKPGAKLDGESGLYSASIHHTLLLAGNGSVVAVWYQDQSPDISVDRVKVGQLILRTLRIETR
jgi:hypothetical protein